jgi:malonyl-CoA O-methyltransferase
MPTRNEFRVETVFDAQGRVFLFCSRLGGDESPAVVPSGARLNGATVDPWPALPHSADPAFQAFILGDPADRGRFTPGEVVELEGAHTVLSTRGGYDRWAEIYDAEDNPLVALEEQVLGGTLSERVGGLRIADVGCGTGRRALDMARAGAKVTAVDFSEGMLERARRKPGAEAIELVVHDITTPLPFPTESFDAATCFLVLDHIDDPGALFAELRRIVRPRGFVLATVMHPAMMLRGIQAQFSDPESGEKLRPRSAPNQIADYVAGVVDAGLEISRISEHVVDPELVRRSPRAARYMGWPLLLVLWLRVRDRGA